jgi:hypothetical protein
MDLTKRQLPASTRKRRWFRYSLRTLLVVVLLVSGLLGCLRRSIEATRRERAALIGMGCDDLEVGYDNSENAPHDNRFELSRWRWPSWAWARRLLGDDFPRHVIVLHFWRATGCDRGLRYVGAFRELQVLDLANVQVSDRDTPPIAELKELRALYLHDTNISNESLVHLHDLRHLRVLNLNGTGVDDDGMKHLEHLSSLNRLTVKQTAVTRTRVEELRRALPRCTIEY